MEQAADACVQWIMSQFPPGSCMIFCGPGNNGGDGLAIARMLHEAGYEVQVFIIEAERYSADVEVNLARLQQLPLRVQVLRSVNEFPAPGNSSIVIDALLGTGLNRPPAGIIKSLIDHLNSTEAPVISIDIPSGMYCDSSSLGNSVLKATHTLSLENYKLCFLMAENLRYCGNIVLLDIGLAKDFPASLQTSLSLVTKQLVQALFKPRPAWVHKYNLGHALVVAGSPQMMGAALLCAKACMRAGAGLVTLYDPFQNRAQLNAFVPEVISTDETDMEQLLLKKSAICFGPGLQVNGHNKQLLQKILSHAGVPLLVDASGLSILKEMDSLYTSRNIPLIITPHSGEFDKLFGKNENDFERMYHARRLAKERSLYIVLKAPHTIIACPDGELYFNNTGNSGMATAGSGDVLSGIITALLGQGYTAKSACLLGVWLHGWAGDIAAGKISKEALMATDIMEHMGQCFLALNKQGSKNE